MFEQILYMVWAFLCSMADVHFWLMIGIAVLLLILLVIFLFFGRRKGIDYYTLFLSGMVWTAVGIPLHNYVLSAVGFVMVIIGLVNKKKWKKQKSLLSGSERKRRILVLVGLAVLVILVFVYLLLRR